MRLLEQLASGDSETWNEAFHCLYPVAFEAARTRLGDAFIEDCKDVAMETLSDILEKGIQVNSETELKPLTAAIARNKATDRLRKHLAEKRGGNKVQSLEEMIEVNAGEPPDVAHDEFVDHLAVQELRELLTDLSAEVKKEYRVVLRDHFFDQLSYNEIAAKRKISVGSVGVYLQRGLTNLRSVIARRPKLQGEFFAMLSDASVVKVFLPLVSAVQLGGWLASQTAGIPLFSAAIMSENLEKKQTATSAKPDSLQNRVSKTVAPILQRSLTDEEKLQMIQEALPHSRSLDESRRSVLLDKLEKKRPVLFQIWQRGQEERIRREKEFRQQRQKSILRHQIIVSLILLGILYGIFRLFRWLF